MTELLRTLFVTTPGTSLHLEGDTVRIHHPERPGRNILPLVRIEQLVVWRGVDVSNELLLRCTDDQRGITWLSRNGRFLGRVGGAQTGNPLLRLEQVRAYDDPHRRLTIAKAVVAGKLQNYRQLLLRIARDADEPRKTEIRAVAQQHSEALAAVAASASLTELLGIEGMAARSYFQAMPMLARGVPQGRTRRPPQDPFNCVLSFGYGMLRVAVVGALEQVGLDPYIGYLHGVRSGKPSLALDLMEELRPLLVDRLVLALFNRKKITAKHTMTDPGGGVTLTEEGRKLVLNEWSQARERLWKHSGVQHDVPAALLPLVPSFAHEDGWGGNGDSS
ncbi:CRISPR-associated endonuclease Cas1 [Saccharopolyspora phatthalungensis]|uniref:CRISPR-associated endonuclease Cas1 n=1 Tax=Saccharopolyspora phatthalungensis TaxID=664693 RepID=A0A840Q9B8_9PSEU|nr:CRISPR-associated endonuclease Cas1 [Saccharopolyspora phatthalungensis]MBB5156527.1 CRISPR-associated protein Cas1 [Saccharopolyspora phatthalungensis]